MSKATKCTYCGEALDKEEGESPRTDHDGDPMCDECYHEHFEFTCCWCQGYGDVEDQHKLLVVFDAEEAFGRDEREAGYGAGLYRIQGDPYYGSDYLSMWLRVRYLQRIGPVPAGAEGDGYLCGHLCGPCQQLLAWPYEVVLPGEPCTWAPGFRGSEEVVHCRTLKAAVAAANQLNRDRPGHAPRRRDTPGLMRYGGFYEPRPVGWRVGMRPERSTP